MSAPVSMTLYAALERIVELEAENERLKCCGNCSGWASMLPFTPDICSRSQFGEAEMSVDVLDPCHFTPSRWEAKP